MSDVAKRLVRCPQWRWMPGMRWSTTVADFTYGGVFRTKVLPGAMTKDYVPDLADPATGGALLAMLYEAARPRGLMVALVPNGDGYGVGIAELEDRTVHTWPYDGDTLGEACALALLALWEAK